MDESLVKWEANEGIRISRICEFLKLHHGSHPAVASLLKAIEPPAVRSDRESIEDQTTPAAASPIYWRENQLFVSLPVSALASLETRATPLAAPAVAGEAPAAGAMEKVEIDTSTYSSRPGYQPNFLGGVSVPLPKLTTASKAVAAPLKGSKGPGLLKYHTYSAMMHGKRRLALFSCVNIDGTSLRDTGERQDSWITDSRMEEKFQLGQSFYSGILQAEAERRTPWDRGHLVRRLDATWGTTVDDAKRNGDDTFHFTNCAPQHFAFNQGAGAKVADNLNIAVSRLWAGLEDHVLKLLINEARRACVFNGPIFGAADPKFNNVPIPLEYWKILVINKGGKLSAAGFVLSQKVLVDQVTGDEEFKPRPLSDVELKLAQRPIAEIAKRTQLNFGSLVKADAFRSGTESAGRATIESFSDVRI